MIERIRTATRDDGTPLFTPATAASLLVFFVLAMQCLPTLAVTRRETGRIKWAALQFGYMSALAYALALVAYTALRLGGDLLAHERSRADRIVTAMRRRRGPPHAPALAPPRGQPRSKAKAPGCDNCRH